MSELTTFIFKEYTVDGYPVLVAGICPLIFKQFAEAEIKEKIKSFKIDAVDNPYYIDYMLASYISEISPKCLYALGISINIPGISGPTGGIIGNPLAVISSAEGLSEYIDNGLSMAAYPGGPGIVINGKPHVAKEILRTVKPGDGEINTLLNMAEIAVKYDIKIAIIISDGTGTSYPGAAVTIENRKINYFSIT
ncbi:hypothetical protein [Fonticella tunisiensis]|uniref:Uncharacterized protein n=1 Tax=Fonticella tunisiensis TaxID=1096341 RepID=A0A4R7KUT3_9CLOT|nr:hypothetical protein [Fonticella tunisiensis]TDT61900.1 hypothetical protein EDD71_10579 [Fonticella tunisiensis]